MRVPLIAVCASVLWIAPGCTRLCGKFPPVDKCSSANLSPASALARAPAWVPGSPSREHMPVGGCVGGDGSHYTDRLCAVAVVERIEATETSRDLAGTQSLRLLAEELEGRLVRVVGTSVPADQLKALSKQLKAVIGHVTGAWQSPNCTTYAIAEMKLSDFQFVMEGPSLPVEVRATLLGNAERVIGQP